MSYIRCLSNPEGAYIFSTRSNGWPKRRALLVEICHCVDAPHSSATRGEDHRFWVPERDFYAVCRAWTRGSESVQSGKLSICEVHVYDKTGKLFREIRLGKKPSKARVRQYFKSIQGTSYKIELRYGRHFVRFWKVTWAYIADSVVERDRMRQIKK